MIFYLLILEKPETPLNLKTSGLSSTSVRLSWLSGSNGGENSTYLININNAYNLTTYVDVLSSSDDYYSSTEPSHLENRFNMIELRGLESGKTYDFKILAFNSMGASDFNQLVRVQTPKAADLNTDKIPKVLSAHFNEVHEAICFELSSDLASSLTASSSAKTNDYIVKIDISLNEELVSAAQDLIKMNNRSSSPIGSSSSSSSSFLFSQRSIKQFKNTLDNLNTQFRAKSYFIDLNQAQSCILYSQLLNLDWQMRNAANLSALKKLNMNNFQPIVYDLNTIKSNQAVKPNSNNLPIVSSIYSSKSENTKLENLITNFIEFKRFHKVNLTICYKNDSSICAEKISVYDYQTDFSNYITLVAIGCSAVLIFIILLIASLCCCCCRRRSRNKKNGNNDDKKQLKGELTSKLNIKSFPIISAQHHSNHQGGVGSNYDLSSGSSAKSSQQHILNGSSSPSSSSGISTNGDHVLYGITQATYKIQENNGASPMIDQSDNTSSSSLENKTLSNKSSSNNHSPYNIITENRQSTHNMIPQPLTSSSYSNFYTKPINPIQTTHHNQMYRGSLNNKPPGMISNVYIKSYNNNNNHSNQHGLMINNHHLLKQSNKNSSGASTASSSDSSHVNHSQESTYSTPIINHTINSNKKLVYEVIV